MKRIHSDAKKLLSTSFMLVALATVMFAGAEKAFANPGPAHAGNPPLLQVVQGGQGQMKISALAVNTFGAEIAIYSNENIILSQNAPCPLPAPAIPNLKYQLMDADGALVGYRLLAAGDFVQVPWGHGVFINALQVQTSAGGSLVKGATTTAPTFPLHWEEVNDGNTATADDTSNVSPLPDSYRLASCGVEGGGAGQNYQDSGGFQIVLPVGGSIIPVDASALLIAGLFTTPLMMIPAVGAAVGTAFTIYKLRK